MAQAYVFYIFIYLGRMLLALICATHTEVVRTPMSCVSRYRKVCSIALVVIIGPYYRCCINHSLDVAGAYASTLTKISNMKNMSSKGRITLCWCDRLPVNSSHGQLVIRSTRHAVDSSQTGGQLVTACDQHGVWVKSVKRKT